jgi:hypothetical protein
MRVINKPWRPRRTAIVERVRRAIKEGKTRILLTTAVDVYGAANIVTQFKDSLGIIGRVRREGDQIFLYINPKKPSSLVKNRALHRNNMKLRNALTNLKKDQCVVLNTPMEAHAFIGLRANLKKDGMMLRSVRNCTSLMVWRDTKFREPIDIFQNKSKG